MSKPLSELGQRDPAIESSGSGAMGRLNKFVRSSHWVTLACAAIGAIATTGLTGLGLERQVQTLFFELRGPFAAPHNIVILAIDEQSLAQEQTYRTDPEKYAELEALQSWPWKRAAYAEAIDKVMAAGAKAVALNILFDAPSSYGIADDQRLQASLNRYPGRIALAANYDSTGMRQGNIIQLIQPHPQFRTKDLAIGTINFPLESDRQIHQLGRQFPQQLAQTYPEQAEIYQEWSRNIPSLAEATLQAAKIDYPSPRGPNIFFYGPVGSFEQIPFWQVLNPDNWNTYLQAGQYFKDKIVLIGPTASLFRDFHNAPFSGSDRYPEQLAGIEVHANAIATLLENRAIAPALPPAPLGEILLFAALSGIGWGLSRTQRLRTGLIWTFGAIALWTTASYLLFTHASLVVPTVIPAIAIAGTSTFHLTRRLSRSKSQPVELALPQSNNTAIETTASAAIPTPVATHTAIGKILSGRYQITEILGTGGFGETYIAQDIQRPGNPPCVVKQLKIATDDANVLQVARRLFHREAQTLEKLGHHDQIPQLYAYLEEDQEFYLVQELIFGTPLSQELIIGRQLSESTVIAILLDLLQVLEFIHRHGVIHRDIKPSNIIRRDADRKLVLIDFGAVKLISNASTGNSAQSSITVGIGTRGYAPREQCLGKPLLNSDLYALGTIGIQALTGLPVSSLHDDPKTGELVWQHHSKASHELAVILNKMVRSDYRHRYQTTTEVLADLQPLAYLAENLQDCQSLADLPTCPLDLTDAPPTKPWVNQPKPDTQLALDEFNDSFPTLPNLRSN